MRFNEWRDRVIATHLRVKEVALQDIVETIAVNGSDIQITMGREFKVAVDGNPTDLRYLRTLYTKAKEEFLEMLESLEASVDAVKAATEGLMVMVTDQAIPELVVKRLTGDNPACDTRSVLNHMAGKKLSELVIILKPLKDMDILQGFELINLQCAGEPFSLNYAIWRFNLTWAGLSLSNQARLDHDIELNLKFLANFDAIKTKLEQIVAKLCALKELEEE